MQCMVQPTKSGLTGRTRSIEYLNVGICYFVFVNFNDLNKSNQYKEINNTY